MRCAVKVTVAFPEYISRVSVITDASGKKKEIAVSEQRITVEVPALNALLMEF